MDDPSSGWGVGDTQGGAVGYAGGALEFDVVQEGAWIWTRRELETSQLSMRVLADFVADDGGLMGLACAASDDLLYGGAIGTDGGWAFFTIDSEGVHPLDSDREAGLDVPMRESNRLALDCSTDDDGNLRLQMHMADAGIIASYEGTSGPGSFDRVAVYAESTSSNYGLRAEQVVAFGLAEPTQSGRELRGHVPGEWQDTCYELPLPVFHGAGALANIVCNVDSSGAEIAKYASFATVEAMNAAYQGRVSIFGVESTGTCQSGPNEIVYNISGMDAGRVLCAPQARGIRFDWTDERLFILSTLTDFDGDYGEAYEDWGIAGPN